MGAESRQQANGSVDSMRDRCQAVPPPPARTALGRPWAAAPPLALALLLTVAFACRGGGSGQPSPTTPAGGGSPTASSPPAGPSPGGTSTGGPEPSGHILFVTFRDGEREIYTMNADGSDQT